MSNRVKKYVEYLHSKGWMGEAGLGLLICAAVGLPVHLFGSSGALWGVPMSLVWGGSAGVGTFFLTASLRLIPTHE